MSVSSVVCDIMRSEETFGMISRRNYWNLDTGQMVWYDDDGKLDQYAGNVEQNTGSLDQYPVNIQSMNQYNNQINQYTNSLSSMSVPLTANITQYQHTYTPPPPLCPPPPIEETNVNVNVKPPSEEPAATRRVPFSDEENRQLCRGILKYNREWSKILDYGKSIFHTSRTRDSLRMRANTMAFKKKYDEYVASLQ